MAEKKISLIRYYDEDTNAFLREEWVDEITPPVEPPVDPPEPGDVEWHSFTPRWQVGASGGELEATPSPQGWYKETPVILVIGDNRVAATEIEVFLELEMDSPNIPAGEGMEFVFPAYLTPNSPRTGRGSTGDLWIEGGANHYSVSGKWTDRNNRPMRVIIVLGNGQEWTRNVPKEVVKGSLYLWMKYLK
jgi:hypothetical protein